MWLLLGVFLLGYVSMHLMYQSMVQEVQVNGPLYQRIVEGKDIVADILPPPEYIIESYLVVLQMVQEPESDRRNELIQ
jgi:methyl-accepting chemotaxis protein